LKKKNKSYEINVRVGVIDRKNDSRRRWKKINVMTWKEFGKEI